MYTNKYVSIDRIHQALGDIYYICMYVYIHHRLSLCHQHIRTDWKAIQPLGHASVREAGVRYGFMGGPSSSRDAFN